MPKRAGKPKYLCCNADEGEPGTFKDRIIMERDPHQLIEGLAISGYAIGAETAYVYIRGEYTLAIQRLEQAIAEAHAKGYLGTRIRGSDFNFVVHIHCGAGAYICGEETAMLDSLEGKRAQPRLKPPFPAVEGLYASPTVINNVETLACVPHIVLRGGRLVPQHRSRQKPRPEALLSQRAGAEAGPLRAANGYTAARTDRR